jgi:hypothetical protein
MEFLNIINGKYFNLIETLNLSWYEHSLHRGGQDIILESGGHYYYGNTNRKDKLYNIEDISVTLQKIQSTPYRSPMLKEQQLTNYRTIFDALKRYERQKKLTLLIK